MPTPELIASITALLIAVVSGVATWRRDSRTAKKEELDQLRDRVNELVAREQESLEHIAMLRHIMTSAGLQVPPLPPLLQRLLNQQQGTNGPSPRKRKRRPGIWGGFGE